MPLKLNVGASKKVGEANYGSRGASVNVELELDSNLISDPAKMKEKIRQLFVLVRTSLAEELNAGNGHAAQPPSAQPAPQPVPPRQEANGAQQRNVPRPASPAQIKAIYAMARRVGVDLGALLLTRFQVRRPDDLTLRQASSVIDELKGTGDQAAG
jgi:hypothetical protein